MTTFSPIFARVEGDEYFRFGDKLRLQLKLKVALRLACDRVKSKTGGQEKAQAEYDLFVRARDLLSKHYRALAKVLCCVQSVLSAEMQLSMTAQMCPHEVPQTIDSADFVSFIDARDGAMSQDIHLDSFASGWSFLTAHQLAVR